MGWHALSTRTPIGIDLGGRCIHAMQLARRSRGWQIQTVASMPRGDDSALLSAAETRQLANVLYRHGFRGGDVVLAVPGASVMATMLEVPPRSPAAAVPQLARDRLAAAQKCEPEALEVSCWALPAPTRSRGGTRALAVGCATDEANALIDLFEASGMTVEALDVEAWAAVRACVAHLDGASRLVAILNVGLSAAHLVVLCDGVVVHERLLPEHGRRHLHEILAREFKLEPDIIDYVVDRIGLDPEASPPEVSARLLSAISGQLRAYLERLESDLLRSMSYATQEYAEDDLSRLIVHGDGAGMPGLSDHIAAVLGIDVRVATPSDTAVCPAALETVSRSPALVMAMGLALHSRA